MEEEQEGREKVLWYSSTWEKSKAKNGTGTLKIIPPTSQNPQKGKGNIREIWSQW